MDLTNYNPDEKFFFEKKMKIVSETDADRIFLLIFCFFFFHHFKIIPVCVCKKGLKRHSLPFIVLQFLNPMSKNRNIVRRYFGTMS